MIMNQKLMKKQNMEQEEVFQKNGMIFYKIIGYQILVLEILLHLKAQWVILHQDFQDMVNKIQMNL